MKLTISTSSLFVAMLLTIGCHRTRPQVTTITPMTDTLSRSTLPPPTPQVARGELRSALLHLQRVHFAFDGATLSSATRESLAGAAVALVANPDVRLDVDGHTDERGTSEYNLALGERRAAAVIHYLVSLGVNRERLVAGSFGEESPLRDGREAGDLAANRRVDFRLRRGNVELVLDDGPRYADDGTPLADRAAALDQAAGRTTP